MPKKNSPKRFKRKGPKKPGKRAVFSDDEVIDILITGHYNIFDENDKVLPLSDEVWDEILKSGVLCGKLKISSLQLRMDKNRNGITDRLRTLCHESSPNKQNEPFGTQNLGSNSKLPSDNELDSKITSNESSQSDNEYSPSETSERELNELKFEVRIKKEDFLKIQPEEVLYGVRNRTYRVLRGPWTHLICTSIWNMTSTPCDFALKSYMPTSSKCDYYLKIEGYCREPRCGVSIRGFCFKKPPPDSDLLIHMSTYDSSHIPHYSKKQVKGEIREAAEKVLLHKKPSAFVDDVNDELMAFRSVHPALAPSAHVCRMIRHQASKKQFNYGSSKDLLKFILSSISSEDGPIKDFCAHPFSLVYWTKYQEAIWKFLNDGLTIYSMKIDAAGKFVGPVKIFGLESGPTFLYSAVVNCVKHIVPVTQMISSRHDAVFIGYRWLKEWRSVVGIIPRIVVTDNSLGLQHGVCLAFNDMSYWEVLDHWYKFLRGIEHSLPPCWARMDIAHLIHAVIKWLCLQNVHPNVKDFIVKTVGYMSTLTTLDEFESFSTNVAVLVISPYTNEHVDDARTSVFETLSTYKLPALSENDTDTLNESTDCSERNQQSNDLDKELDDGSSGMASFIEDIFAHASERSGKTGDKKNPYHCPGAEKSLKTLWKQAPAWSNLLLESYTLDDINSAAHQVSTSADIECYFFYLRKIRELVKGQAAEVFTKKHLKSISSAVKIGYANVQRERLRVAYDSQNISPKTSEAPNACFVQLTSSKSSREADETSERRGIHVRPDPDLIRRHEILSQKPKSTKRGSGSIKNNVMNACKSALPKSGHVIRDSSLFDSLFELVLHSYVNYPASRHFMNEMHKASGNFFLLTIIEFYTKNSTANYEKRRMDVLKAVGRTDGNEIFCPDNVVNLLISVFNGIHNSSTEVVCTQCSFRTDLQKNLSILIDSSPTASFWTVLDNSSEGTCPLCGNGTKTSMTLEGFLVAHFPTNICAIEQFTEQISIRNKVFILVGGVGKFPTGVIKNYLSFLRSVRGRWSYHNNMQKKFKSISIDTEVDVSFLLYAEHKQIWITKKWKDLDQLFSMGLIFRDLNEKQCLGQHLWP